MGSLRSLNSHLSTVLSSVGWKQTNNNSVFSPKIKVWLCFSLLGLFLVKGMTESQKKQNVKCRKVKIHNLYRLSEPLIRTSLCLEQRSVLVLILAVMDSSQSPKISSLSVLRSFQPWTRLFVQPLQWWCSAPKSAIQTANNLLGIWTFKIQSLLLLFYLRSQNLR